MSLLAEALADARDRSLGLLAPLPDATLVCQHSPLMSPLAWDLGHVANYEEQWLVRHLGGAPCGAHLDDMYDAFRHPRRSRQSLPILTPAAARAYGVEVRERALELMTAVETDGFVHRMVVQHEHQHDETMLAALQLLPAPGYQPVRVRRPQEVAPAGEVLLPGGEFLMGTSTDPWALDNERPAHVVRLDPFWMEAAPVTNRAYEDFVVDGGYRSPRWWTPAGWAWRQEAGLCSPEFWDADGSVDRFGWLEARRPEEPVQHVCWYEADAYARWAGKRLPTEAEWEFAATDGGGSRWPWGNTDPSREQANLWYGPASTYGPSIPSPAGANRWGVAGLIGDVWEWTSSDFAPYPGFAAWPYKEYSEVFFGPDYKVLRGGSWASHPTAMRATFRNWDYPIRRQIFAGFRCVRTA